MKDSQGNLSAWIEWRERCALGLCSNDTKAILQNWAHAIAARAWSGTLNDQLDWAWHLFESRFVPKSVERGKEPKFQMFEAAAIAADEEGRRRVLESYAAKVLFSSLRDCAVAETWGRRDVKTGFQKLAIERIDAPETPPLESLLGSEDNRELHPDSAAALEELVGIAATLGEAWWTKMPKRERVALGAAFTGRSLTDPTILGLAECGKSQLYAAKGTAVRRLVESINEEFLPENDVATVRELTMLVLRFVGQKCGTLVNFGKSPEG